MAHAALVIGSNFPQYTGADFFSKYVRLAPVSIAVRR